MVKPFSEFISLGMVRGDSVVDDSRKRSSSWKRFKAKCLPWSLITNCRARWRKKIWWRINSATSGAVGPMTTQASVYIVMRSTATIVHDGRTLRLKRDLEYLYLFVERPVPVVEGEEACRLLKLCADLFFDRSHLWIQHTSVHQLNWNSWGLRHSSELREGAALCEK